MTHSKAAALLLAIILLVIAYLGFAYLIGVTEFWTGFLFLVSWAIIEQMQVSRLPAAIAGSTGGALVACIPALFAPILGEPIALGIMLALIVLAIYAILVGWLPVVINNNFMLFLNVLSIPYIVQLADPVDMAKGLAAGVLFFGGLALISAWFGNRRQRGGATQP